MDHSFCVTLPFIILVCGILFACPVEVDAAPILKLYSREPSMDSGSRLHNRLWGSDKDDSYREVSISRENSEDLFGIRHHPIPRKATAAGDGYPSPHGKVTGWRFDLRKTVEADRSLLNTAGRLNK
jgi:hypothetical protein